MVAGLCKEVENRMGHVGVKGLRITLQVKQRKPRAGPPPKLLGHGLCHNLSKSADLTNSQPTRNWEMMNSAASALFKSMKVNTNDVRVIGIVASKLVIDDCTCNEAPPNKGQKSIASLFAAHK